MPKPSPPPINLDLLSSDGRHIARLVRAPEHAWVKEFLRAYLGPVFATRAMIRTVAPRIVDNDALIGLTLEVVRTATDRIHPSDAVALIAATPRIPGPVVRENLTSLAQLYDTILAHYDPPTCVRILESLLHTVGQQYAREVPFDLHTPESLRYVLSVRNETIADGLTDWVANPIPEELAETLAEILPELLNAEARDATLAAGLIINQSITRRLSDAQLRNITRILAGFTRVPTTIALLEAIENPDLRQRELRFLSNFVHRAYRMDSLDIRAAALRTLVEPSVRAARPNATTAMLRNALRGNEWALNIAALDVISSAGFTVLGKDGEAFFTNRVNRWIAARARAGTAARVLLYMVEDDFVRYRIADGLLGNILHRLAQDRDPDVRARAGTIIGFLDSGGRSTDAPAEREIPEFCNLGLLSHAIAIMTERQGVGLPDAEAVRNWRDLDPDYDVELPVPPESRQVDGRTLRVQPPLRVVVLRTARSLESNSRAMRNCTRSWRSFLDGGDRILVALEDPQGRTRYNADWLLVDRRWQLESCYGRANEILVPVTVTDALRRMTNRLNRHVRDGVEPQLGR